MGFFFPRTFGLFLQISFFIFSLPLHAVDFETISTKYTRLNGSDSAELIVSGNVRAPVGDVWKVLTLHDGRSCTHTKEILQFSIQKTGENEYSAYYLLDFPWPLENRWQRLRICHMLENRRIAWELTEGTIKSNKGYYHLEDHGFYTKVNYSVKFDPGIKFLPDSFIQYIVKKQAPNSLKKLRKCLE